MTIPQQRLTQMADAMQRVCADRQPSARARSRIELVRGEAKAAAADLYIYGTIGDDWYSESVAATDVVQQLNEMDGSVTTLNVYINSIGGSVADGLAIYNALRRKAAAGVDVLTHVDGVAASIASLILCAGNTVSMPANTRLMVHAPWGGLYVSGNSADVRKAAADFADVLDGFADAMAEGYVEKTGMPKDAALALLTDGQDHWYSAAEAKVLGFCDTVIGGSADAETDDDDSGSNAPAAARAVATAPLAMAGTQQAAQPAATVQETTMSETTTPKAGAQQPQAATDVLAALRVRNDEIKALAMPHFRNADVKAYYDDVIAAADPTVTAGDVGKQILAILGKGRESLNPGRVEAGPDQREKSVEAMVNAVESRAGVAKAESGNPFVGMSLSEIARACAERAGADVRGKSRHDIVGLAFTHSTSDFPGLLGTAARKAVLKGYQEVETALESITTDVSVPDFLERTLMGLGAFSDLDRIPEGGEYKYGTFSEQSQRVRLVTFGKLFSITRQAIINDDLGVFNEVPRKMGQAARRTVARALFDLLASNPVMADGKPLFHADHGNLVTPGSTISTTSVDQMRTLMALQKDSDGNTIRMPLAALLVPVALRGQALTVKSSQYAVDGSKNLTTPNIVRDTFEVYDDPRLDAQSSTAWYGLAEKAVADTLVIAYLDGQKEPYLEEQQGFTVDGVAWKVRIDAAPAIADWRGIVKNPGA